MQNSVIFVFFLKQILLLLKFSALTIICNKLFLNLGKYISSRFCQLLSLNMFEANNSCISNNHLFMHANKIFLRKNKITNLVKINLKL